MSEINNGINSRTQVRVLQKTHDHFEYLAEDNFKSRTANILLKRIIDGDFNHLKRPESDLKTPLFVNKELASEALKVAHQLGYSRLGDFIDRIFEEELYEADDIFYSKHENE